MSSVVNSVINTICMNDASSPWEYFIDRFEISDSVNYRSVKVIQLAFYCS